MIAGNFDRSLARADLCYIAAFVRLLGVNSLGVMAAHQVAALAAHGLDVDLTILVAVNKLECGLENVGVESAGKSLVSADDNQQHTLFRARDKERMAQVAGGLIEKINPAGK